MMNKEILLIGTGAQAKYALEIFTLRDKNVAGLIVLPGERLTVGINGVEVLGGLDNFENIYAKYDQPALLFCCSKNQIKEQLEKELSKYSPRYANAIHPTAVIAGTANLGDGLIINANAIVQPYARIGNHVMIHAGVVIEHDCDIDNFTNLAPRVTLAGYVKIGKGTTIYTGAVVIPSIKIGENAVVGAGSVVLKNVSDDVTVAGCPARKIRAKN